MAKKKNGRKKGTFVGSVKYAKKQFDCFGKNIKGRGSKKAPRVLCTVHAEPKKPKRHYTTGVMPSAADDIQERAAAMEMSARKRSGSGVSGARGRARRRR